MTELARETRTGRSAAALMLWTASLVLLVNLLVIALCLIFLAQSKEKYLQNAEIQSQNLAHTLEHSIAGMIDSADIALSSVIEEAQRELSEGRIDSSRFNAFIARQHAHLPAADSMQMADAGGRIRYGTGVVPGANQMVSELDYFIKLRDDPGAGLVISKPVQGVISGKWVVIVARRVNGSDRSFAGVAYCAIDLEKVRSMLSSVDVGAGGRITLLDATFGIVVRHPLSRDFPADIGRKPASGELLSRLEQGLPSGTFLTSPTAERSHGLTSYRGVGRYPLYISVCLAQDDYLAPWQADKVESAALVILFVLVTLALSRVIYLKWRRQLEVEEELQSAKDELELRVSQRTEELHRVNERLKSELAERAHAEEKLRQGSSMLAQIINTIPQSVFWKDRGSIYLGCNIHFARAAGIDHPQDIRGKSDYDLPWLPEETEAYRKDDRSVMDGNCAKYHIIEQQQQAGGVRYWVDTTKVPLKNERGEVTGVLGVYEDISEKKAVEESRNKALALVESLLASSPTGIIVFDGVSGECVKANQAFADMAGGSVEGLYARNFRELDTWKEAGIDLLAEEVLADAQTRSIDVSLHTIFGKLLEATCFLSRFDVEGRPHLMLIAVDLAEKKRLEQEKRHMEAQMLHVQKLESLGLLAGGIAHDFNNILMVVLGYADLALTRLEEGSPLRENLEQIEQAATRAADLAQQMLAYSGRGTFEIENLDVTRIAREMAQMLEISVSKKVLLRYDFAEDLPGISGDATQLRQVILNLVMNAAEAIGDASGEIVIRTSYLECDRSYLSESWIDDGLPEGGYVALEVSDTGCGIDRDIIPKIFDPFFTTKFTGRGLGMASVLGIVRSHQGAIKIYSEKGKGSTFKLLLPALSVGEQRRELPASAVLWHGSGTVLLADDEQSIRALGQQMLQSLGFHVLTACDGNEAVEIFRREGGGIACVLLDLTMPGLDGEQTFRALREIDPEVRVIISSGYNEREVSRKLSGAGLSGFIQKPYKLAEVSRKLQLVLEGG